VESTISHASREAVVPGLVVVGASTGGVQALTTLVSDLPPDFPWAILVVLHVGNHHSVLPDLLASRGPLPAARARTEDRILPGRIYVAPPDRHLIVEDGHIQVTKGPKEHFTRPAIDPLFLSAALVYGRAVVGVVLTGALDDGTAGLQAVKECGGTTVVQDPDDAQDPSMPRNALKYVEVDHCSPIADMPALLVKLTRLAPALGASPQPERLVHEQALALAAGNPLENLAAIARPSTFVCPDCSGSLWQYKEGKPIRVRCHTGHAYTLKSLQYALTETADMALWTAARALQEQSFMLGALVAAQREDGDDDNAPELESVQRSVLLRARRLRQFTER
jgi:two-component system chemotaxis response regulator CheB